MGKKPKSEKIEVPQQGNDVLMAAEAARILEVSPRWVAKLESAGKLPATKTSSGVRLFKRSDVLDLKKERKRPAT